MDDLDLRILGALQRDASTSNDELAKLVFTSAATALRRVRLLKESGVIERVNAVLSPSHVGPAINAISEITLDTQNIEAFSAFEKLVIDEAAITQCYRTAPQVDYTLILTLRSIDEYNGLAKRVFTATNNVRNVRTRFATARLKATLNLPV